MVVVNFPLLFEQCYSDLNNIIFNRDKKKISDESNQRLELVLLLSAGKRQSPENYLITVWHICTNFRERFMQNRVSYIGTTHQ